MQPNLLSLKTCRITKMTVYWVSDYGAFTVLLFFQDLEVGYIHLLCSHFINCFRNLLVDLESFYCMYESYLESKAKHILSNIFLNNIFPI